MTREQAAIHLQADARVFAKLRHKKDGADARALGALIVSAIRYAETCEEEDAQIAPLDFTRVDRGTR